MNNYPKAFGFSLFWIISAFQSDNGALFFGSLFGRKPLAPIISPKKTVEGVYGAVFLR
jgi:phosphatidate cytidylyltransferase